MLYESTGLVGRSSLRKVDLTSGAVKQQVAVPEPYFAEGLADVGNRLFQLTWQHGRVFVYDKNTLNRVSELGYEGEGWGLCHDGRTLVMSSGSDALTVRAPDTFAGDTNRQGDAGRAAGRSAQRARVRRRRRLRQRLDDRNDRPHRFEDGAGDGHDRCSGLLAPAERPGIDVLNGIAYDPADQTFLITGKLWPKLFRVKFVP